MEVKTTKERILEAASKCSTAKETLKTLFPEVFVEDKSVEVPDEVLKGFICRRDSGEFAHKAFFLTTGYNWELKKDSADVLILIPTKK